MTINVRGKPIRARVLTDTDLDAIFEETPPPVPVPQPEPVPEPEPAASGVEREDGEVVGCWWRWTPEQAEQLELMDIEIDGAMDCASCYGNGVCSLQRS